MNTKQKRVRNRIIIGAILFLGSYLIPLEGLPRLLLYLIVYFIIGGDILLKAGRNILKGQIFDENFLMCIATIGAFIIGEYPEAAAVMLFYQVGELFQNYAVNRSRTSISSLMDIRPDYANIEQNGELVKVDPYDVSIGDHIVVKPGERIPLDGVVIKGTSMLDTSALTGESVPRQTAEGDEVLSGCINKSGVLTIETTKEFDESTVSKILDLVENASSRKSKTENFITKFARYYTPVVVIGAVLLAVVPPLILPGAQFFDWFRRALIFLVVSCPCALVISIPLGFFGGIGGASKCGILLKGSNYMEALASAEIVVFDKTGTLTKGTFEVTKIYSVEEKPEELLEIAAIAESYSDHPISLSLKKAYGKEIDRNKVAEPEEIAGHGIKVTVDGSVIAVGNRKLMNDLGVSSKEDDSFGTQVHVAIDQKYAGYIVISDEIKEDAKETIKSLRENWKCKTVMLTGDRKQAGEYVAESLGIDKVYTELLPGDKVDRMEELLASTSPKGKLIFVGDGINDAPVLARADIGVAMGALGADAAIEAADVVIMDDKPSKILTSIKISKKTIRIVKQNIVFALVVKAIVLLLGGLGAANMWEAVFADVGVSVVAILNSMRALQVNHLE